MSYIFGDSFDFYAAIADAGQGYWDTAGAWSIATGRFTGSLAAGNGLSSNTIMLGKSSGSNDTAHHIVVSFMQTVGLTGVVAGNCLTLLDGTTAQCSIVFRTDGAIVLQSGAVGGSTLATYSGAFSANVWSAFEIELTINNTTGVFKVRKDGATSDSFSSTSLNTRGGTSNNYANKLQVMTGPLGSPLLSQSQHRFDDLLWRSDATAPAWVGDVRAYQLMPTTDASTQFTRLSPIGQTPNPLSTFLSRNAGQGEMTFFTAAYTGTISSATVSLNAGGTGNIKAAIYAGDRATVLATSNATVNPSSANVTFTFGTPLSVTRGTAYAIAFDQDFTVTYNITSTTNSGATFTTAYGSFPAAGPSLSVNNNAPVCTINITPTVNAELVADAQEDGTTSYVYDSTATHGDLYNVADFAATPASIVAVTTRGYGQKSDAGSRQGQVQLKSGATTVRTAALALATSFLWEYRTDTVDPDTSAAWTAAAVNAAQIGPYTAA